MNGSATISAAAAFIVGTETGAGLTTTNGTYTGVDPHGDPYASAAIPFYSACNQTNYKLTGNGNGNGNGNNSAILPPANFSGSVYVFCNGLDLTSANVSLTLRSGTTYIIDGGTLEVGGNATLTASGATIMLTNHSGGDPANVKFDSGSTVNLSAPTTGANAGLALFQDRITCSGNNNACGNSLLGGSSQNITGAIYLPDNAVDYKGGSSAGGAQCTQLVAYQMNFKGNSQFNSSCSSAGTKTILVTDSQLLE